MKNRIENLSSIMWFAMDAAWMCEYLLAAKIFAIIAILTSLVFLLDVSMEPKKQLCSDMVSFSVTLWIIMNTLWMLGFIEHAKISFIISLILVIIAAVIWPDGILDRFKRFRKPF